MSKSIQFVRGLALLTTVPLATTILSTRTPTLLQKDTFSEESIRQTLIGGLNGHPVDFLDREADPNSPFKIGYQAPGISGLVGNNPRYQRQHEYARQFSEQLSRQLIKEKKNLQMQIWLDRILLAITGSTLALLLSGGKKERGIL